MNRGETAQRKKWKNILFILCNGVIPLEPPYLRQVVSSLLKPLKRLARVAIHHWAKTPPCNPRLGVDRAREDYCLFWLSLSTTFASTISVGELKTTCLKYLVSYLIVGFQTKTRPFLILPLVASN